MILRAMLLFLALLSVAAGVAAEDSGRPLFQSELPLSLTLQAPWAKLLKSAKTKSRHVAVLSYTDRQGKVQRMDVTVEARGLTRLDFCQFPPLRIRFAKATTRGTLFEGQRSLKLVTHCRAGQKFAQYYIQEMLAYRIYRLFTDVSFRVRPLEISYVDSEVGRAQPPRFAFLVENINEVARRNGLKRDKAARFALSDFDSLSLSRLMLFQYLIGNTDFAVLSGPRDDACCHNSRVLKSADPHGRIAVPYDFDSAGMVDAPYPSPHESLPIKSVRQRLYRGFCQHNQSLAAARQEFQAKRQAVFDLIENQPRLSARTRLELTRYIEDFYTTLNSDYGFAREIIGKCRK